MNSEMIAWTNPVASVVQMGFAALASWWLLTKYLPKMQDDFMKSLKEEREMFLAAEMRRNADSKEKLLVVTNTHREAIKDIVLHCEKESAKRDAAFSSEMGLMEKTVSDVGSIMEEVRDELRDLKSDRRNK